MTNPMSKLPKNCPGCGCGIREPHVVPCTQEVSVAIIAATIAVEPVVALLKEILDELKVIASNTGTGY